MLKRSVFSIDLILPVACAAFVLALSAAGIFEKSDNRVYDSALKLKCRLFPAGNTPRAIGVDLTDSSELQLPQGIADRSAFADALCVLQKAGTPAGFDFLFSGEKNNVNDTRIAALAKVSPRCVFAITPLSEAETHFSGKPLDETERRALEQQLWHPIVRRKGNIPEAARFLMPYTLLTQNAGTFGHIGIAADSDGVERRMPLLYAWGDGYIPSYALAVAARAFSIDTSRVVLAAGQYLSLPLSDGRVIKIPVDSQCRAYIPYTGSWDTTGKHIPFEEFVKGASDEDAYWSLFDLIDGRIVLFSDLSTAKKDFGISPFEPVFPLAGIHAAMLNGICTGVFFRPVPVWGKLIISLCILLLTVLCAGIHSTKKSGIAFGCLFAAVIICSAVIWFAASVVPWCVGLCVAIFTAWFVSFLFRQVHSYKEHLLMEHALERYFPKSLAARVLREGRTDLLPAKKELTMLFSDIAGFTRWSSDKEPEMVHAFLTDYLGSMAEIIFKHGGTVDKFIGDGILAFFGDPFDQPDNAERAVATAVEMQRKIRVIAAKWKPTAGIDLKVRIGVNTGDVIVGNLGTGVRIDYTVIGSAVNLASRMESNAPVGGILVAENAYRKVKDKFSFSGPLPITAKGYDDPVQAYTVAEKFE